jgi:hypothetical protein
MNLMNANLVLQIILPWLNQGHYPSLARVVNCWRASGNARKISHKWVELYGRSPTRLPPRALKGRWGSVDSLEKFLLEDCGSEQLPDVFEKADAGQWVGVNARCC